MLAAATVRTSWPRFVGSFVALSLGVALTTIVVLVLTAAQPRAPRAYEAAPVLVHSGTALQAPWPPEVTADLVRRLGQIPSVAAAIPDRSFYAQVVRDGRPVGDPTGSAGDPAADPQGHGFSATALAGYRLVAGRGPDRAGELALDAGLGPAPGDRVSLLTATGPTEYTVTGLVGGPGIYVDDATAARLATGVRVIGLLPSPGADVGAVQAQARSWPFSSASPSSSRSSSSHPPSPWEPPSAGASSACYGRSGRRRARSAACSSRRP